MSLKRILRQMDCLIIGLIPYNLTTKETTTLWNIRVSPSQVLWGRLSILDNWITCVDQRKSVRTVKDIGKRFFLYCSALRSICINAC